MAHMGSGKQGSGDLSIRGRGLESRSLRFLPLIYCNSKNNRALQNNQATATVVVTS